MLLEKYIPYIVILIVSVIIAKLSEKAAIKLNLYMGIDMIFGFIRYNAARFFAKNTSVDFAGFETIYTETLEEAEDKAAFREEFYTELYDRVNFDSFWFTPFNCTVCLSEWINFVMATTLPYFMGFEWIEIFFIWLISSIILTDDLLTNMQRD